MEIVRLVYCLVNMVRVVYGNTMDMVDYVGMDMVSIYMRMVEKKQTRGFKE